MTTQPWQINTEKLAHQIREAAGQSHTEEDLKMKVEPLLQEAFTTLGIDVEMVRYEKATGFKGRSDALYGFLVIDYKAPGRLANQKAQRDAIGQIKEYMDGEAAPLGANREEALEKFIGVILDGREISFVRYCKSGERAPLPAGIAGPLQTTLFEDLPGFQEIGPFDIDKSSIMSLLIFARGAARQPLKADTLARVFGPGTDIAQNLLSVLYTAVKRAERQSAPSRPKRFFEEWDRLFGVVYGQDIGKAEHAAAETAQLYQLPGGADLKPLLFSIHTYYAWLMKMIAVELLSLQPESVTRGFAVDLASLDDDELQNRLTDLESGQPFSSAGIDNFLEGDFFSWYLDVWTPQIARNLKEAARLLSAFEPGTPRLEPRWTQDLLRNFYEIVVPKKLRHDLGEYYTPDWLAKHLIDRAGYDGDLDKRFLDPACGSGTFLIHAIRLSIEKAQAGRSFDPAKTGKAILHNVVGFDLNPLAVLAARTNYLISIADLLPYIRPVSLPVYLCDSVVPLEQPNRGPLFPADTVVFSTHHRNYVFPISMKTQARIDTFTSEVDKSLRAAISEEGFSRRIKKELDLADNEITQLTEVYCQIKELHDQKQDGIWAKYIKNAFAPEYVGRFDYVIGNPPWIRWKYISDDYRKKAVPVAFQYGVFQKKGFSGRLGAGELDFSMIFTYACASRFLIDGGTLAFLITETVFRMRGAGEGFRSFTLADTDTPLKVLFFEDMVALQPFLTASNKTALFALKRGAKTAYPVPVVKWLRKKGVGRIMPDWSLEEVVANTERHKLIALPIDSANPRSPWQIAAAGNMKQLSKMRGINPYEVRLGAYTSPYGVFRVKVKQVRPDGLVVIENSPELGDADADIKNVKTPVEARLVHPAVNGPEIIRFGIKEYFHLIVTHDLHRHGFKPYPIEWMEQEAPLTLGYLRMFQKNLLERGSKPIRELAEKTVFYCMFGIHDYSIAPYRVAWARTTGHMSAAVISKIKTEFGEKKELIACDHATFIPLDDKQEAHYVCAVMNSSLVQEFLQASCPTAEVGPPSAVKPIAFPKFKPSDRIHQKLAELSEEAHQRVAKGSDIEYIDKEIDKLAGKLWTI